MLNSEFWCVSIFTDQIVDLRNTLRYLGVPIQMVNGSDASFVFGDNFLVVKSTVMPAGKLRRPSHILNYHCTRESQLKGIIIFLHRNGNETHSNIVTNIVITVAINWFISIFGDIFWTLLSAFEFGAWDVCRNIPNFTQLR